MSFEIVSIQDARKWYRETFGHISDDESVKKAYIMHIKKKEKDSTIKPKQYRKGIDTFTRSKANMSIEGIMAATVMTVDAYIWRDKGTDYEDFCKARDWLNFCIEAMEEDNIKENK